MAMKSLKDQLLAKNIVDKKQARKAEHEERLRRKSLGHDGLEAERRRAREAAEAKQREIRKQDKVRERKRQAELLDLEDERRKPDRVEDLAAAGKGSTAETLETIAVLSNFRLAVARARADHGQAVAELEAIVGRPLEPVAEDGR